MDTTKDTEIAIKADGYKDVTYTIAKTSGGGSTTAPSKPETPDNGGITVKTCELVKGYDNYYHITFEGFGNDNEKLSAFVESIKEVKVGDTNYTKSNNSFDFGDSKFGLVMGNYSNDSLKLATNGFNASGETKITIKGTVDGKEVTITYTFTAE